MAAVKKLDIQNERVKVIARFREQGSILRGNKEGRCESFEIELSLQSAEPAEAIAAMIRQAHRMCYTEDTLTRMVPTTTKHVVNGEVLTVADVGV